MIVINAVITVVNKAGADYFRGSVTQVGPDDRICFLKCPFLKKKLANHRDFFK